MEVFSKDLLARAFSEAPQPNASNEKVPSPQTQIKTKTSWRAAAETVDLGSAPGQESARPTLSERDGALLTSLGPLSSESEYLLCTFCSRPCIEQTLAAHVAQCGLNPASAAYEQLRNAKETKPGPRAASLGAETLGASAAGSVSGSAHASGAETGYPTPNSLRKRKADEPAVSGAPATKKKSKREAKPRYTKQRQPFNIDRQCGVLHANGQPCARSLTCKAHSMGAKRAVQGRSAPFDELLAAYQRMNHKAPGGPQTTTGNQPPVANQENASEQDEALLNPEKEAQQVLNTVRHIQVAPLERAVMLPVRARTRGFRLREMLSLALMPRGVAGGGDSLFGRALAFRPDNPGNLQHVRSAAARYIARMRRKP